MSDRPTHVREGFRTLTPYLIVRGAEEVIAFAQRAFGAEELSRSAAPDGTVTNAALRIVDSVVEVSEARGEWPPRPGSLHMYLPDTDAAYRNAIEAGAKSLFEPADQPYGERGAGVEDSAGNHWYIATYTGVVEDE